MKKCIFTLAVLSACIFIKVDAQEVSLVTLAEADSAEGYYSSNPFSSPSALFLIPNHTVQMESRFYPGLVSNVSNNSELRELDLVRNNHFYPQVYEENDPSEEQHKLELKISENKKISFSVNNYNGYRYSLIDVDNVDKIKIGTIENGAINFNNIASGHYLLIVHTDEKIHTKLIHIE